jgi:hypothetical protein
MRMVEILMDHTHNIRNMIVSVCRDAPNASLRPFDQPDPHHGERVICIAMKTIPLLVLYIRCIYMKYEI